MRRRLLLVLSVFSVVAVAAFALPLLASTAAERTQRFVLTRTADLDRLAAYAQQAADPDAVAVLEQEVRAHHAVYGEEILVIDRAGRPIVGAGLGLDEPGVLAAVDAALRNQPVARPEPVWPWSDDPVLFARPIGTGTRVDGAVVMRASTAAAAADIAAAWLLVLLGTVAAALACAGLALALARWVLRPVAELATGVRAVTEGHPGAHVSPHGGPVELRELSVAFNRMSDAVSTSAEQQRRLVTDASHQLRNPLAALRLRVDTLDAHVAERGRRTYRSTLAELERLESLLDGMLGLASAESKATELAAGGARVERTDVAEVVAKQVDLWEPVAERAGVRLVLVEGPPVEAACTASELAQVLDVLLDNAVKHAGAGATAQIKWTVIADRVRLEVGDDGPGLSREDLARATQRFWRGADTGGGGSGLGLAIAEQLVAARGGSLRLSRAPSGGLLVTVELPCP